VFLSSNTVPKEIKYLFIDGGCLRQFVEDSGCRYTGFSIDQMDWKKLVQGFDKVFYYDSLPPRNKNEDEADFQQRVDKQETLFDELRSIPGVHVYEGDARRRRKTVQQKKVDIMIAVDMLTHSFRRNMQLASLFTADLDFKPLIDALVQDGMQVELWYPHGKPNKELIYAADHRRPLTFQALHSWCKNTYQIAYPLPKTLTASGKSILDGFFIEKWPTAMGTNAELYELKAEKTHMVVFPSAFNQDQNYHIHVNHPDTEFLKRYVQECFREFWDSQI
jgi:uncharacterized LabA/DUF88 family protein